MPAKGGHKSPCEPINTWSQSHRDSALEEQDEVAKINENISIKEKQLLCRLLIMTKAVAGVRHPALPKKAPERKLGCFLGAGDGNRTHLSTLGRSHSTDELRPHTNNC